MPVRHDAARPARSPGTFHRDAPMLPDYFRWLKGWAPGPRQHRIDRVSLQLNAAHGARDEPLGNDDHRGSTGVTLFRSSMGIALPRSLTVTIAAASSNPWRRTTVRSLLSL